MSSRPRTAYRPTLRTAAAALCTLALACLLSACGGGGGGGEDSRAAPPASDFPATDGRTLSDVLQGAGLGSGSEGPVVSPAVRVLRVGENRFSFGVFEVDRTPVTDATVAVYAAPGADLEGKAIGPFPARIEDLTTDDAFRARSTADDPNAAKVAYVSQVPLSKPGKWAFGAIFRAPDGSFSASAIPTPGLVGQFDSVPAAGDRAPKVSTPTLADVAKVSDIDTRIPPSDMHDESLDQVLGKKPVVLLFATPALCQSRVCGPVVDAAEQVKSEYGDRVAFIHMEIYRDNDAGKGVRPQVRAYRLPSEPWLFVIDRRGRISTEFEGPYSVTELSDAVRRVAGPPG